MKKAQENKIMLEVPTFTEKQMQLFCSNKRVVIYGGARGGGKSFVIRWMAVILALKYPKIKILIMRSSYPELENNHIIPLQEILNGVARYNDNKKCFKFDNGSYIFFRYCSNKKDLKNIQGHEYEVIFIDEATNLEEEWLKKIRASNRSTTKYKKQFIMTCNPGGVGHNYIKRLKERRFLPKEKAEDYQFIQAKLDDNPYLMEADPEYRQALEELPEKIRKAWLDGDFDIYDGMFFDSFRDNPDGYETGIQTHVIKGKKPAPGWKYFMAYDWGTAKPWAALWFCTDYDGRMYCILEAYGMKKNEPNVGNRWVDDKQFTEIARIEREHPWLKGQKIRHIADPSIFKAQNTGLSTADIALKHGIVFEKGENERIAGWRQVRNRMEFDEDGRPMLLIYDNCEHLRRTMVIAQHDDVDPEDLDSDGEDHLLDCLRYGAMANYIKPRLDTSERIPIFDPLNQYKHKHRRKKDAGI